jgi:hypothetical protein
MATPNIFNCFTENLAEKIHNLQSDQLVIALSNVAPIATNTILTDITEISYTNLSSRNLTVASSTETSGTYSLKINNISLTASGGSVATFRYLVVYNDTAATDPLILWVDYGSGLTLADTEALDITFDSVNGFLTITPV